MRINKLNSRSQLPIEDAAKSAPTFQEPRAVILILLRLNNTVNCFKRNVTWLIIGLLMILVVDPLGVLAGNFSTDSYSQIRTELSKTKNAKVQLVASWDDFYSLEYNNYWRFEMNAEFVERNYAEVLDAASLGEYFFNRYLVSNNITHILVPASSVMSGRIFHKFGTRGTIDISLSSAYFEEVSNSSGPFAAGLFQVINSSQNVQEVISPKYSLAWAVVDSEFYKQKDKVTEVGMYGYDYSTYYESGPDVSWFYDWTADRPDYLELKFETSDKNLETIDIEIELVAAYGPNAPNHVVIYTSNDVAGTVILKAGAPQKISVTIKNNESIRLLNGTPCRVPSSFDPSNFSLTKICFGVSAVKVILAIPAS
jgi:hypothetical protein